MTIDVVEVTPARDDLVAVAVEVHRRTDPELNPGDPPVSADELRGELFSRTTQKHVRTWVALVDGAPAGTLAFELEDNEENRHLAASDWFAVVPVMRRRGVADALLRTALDAVAAAGRTSLLLWAHRNEPDVGGAYARRLGLSEKSEERCSRMRIDTHDSALVERWMREGRSRTDGYRLVPFGDRCPEEHLPPYLEAWPRTSATPSNSRPASRWWRPTTLSPIPGCSTSTSPWASDPTCCGGDSRAISAPPEPSWVDPAHAGWRSTTFPSCEPARRRSSAAGYSARSKTSSTAIGSPWSTSLVTAANSS